MSKIKIIFKSNYVHFDKFQHNLSPCKYAYKNASIIGNMSTCGLLEFKDSSKCSLERSRATSIEKKVIQMNNIFIQTGQLPIRDSELVHIL